MTASKDKGRIGPAAAPSNGGGAEADAASKPRSRRAARIIGAFAAASRPESVPESVPETADPETASQAVPLNEASSRAATDLGARNPQIAPDAAAPFRKPEGPAPTATPSDQPSPDGPPLDVTASDGGDAPAIKAEEIIEEPQEWRVAPSAIDFEDPLLSCLVTLASLLERPISAEALKAGLPHAAERFTPELAVRAAERAGVEARITSRPKIPDILPVTLPCILLLKGGNACVLLGYQGRDQAEITIPEGGTSRKTIGLGELQEQYTGYAIFARPEFKFDQRAADIRLAQPRAWFWGTLAKFWPIYSHVLLASVLINVFALASPLFIMNVYDRVVPNNAIETLWVLALGVATVFA
jgi:hypothetical protein